MDHFYTGGLSLCVKASQELAGYINSQLGDIPLEGAAAPSVPAEQRSSAADTFVEALNGHCVSKGGVPVADISSRHSKNW